MLSGKKWPLFGKWIEFLEKHETKAVNQGKFLLLLLSRSGSRLGADAVDAVRSVGYDLGVYARVPEGSVELRSGRLGVATQD